MMNLVFPLLRWMLVRFTWRQVMTDPGYVFGTLVEMVRVSRLMGPRNADVAGAT